MNLEKMRAVAVSVRSLAMDAIQKANSGHPGLPLGCAELATVLYGEILNHNPANSKWKNRDRFILSAGHGSMLDYSILHLSGYNISLDDIKQFRQIHSICAGHPEYGIADGVEATTGPLGQGIAMAVGMAVAEEMLAGKFNTPSHKIVDHYTYTLIGEGCLMEGVSSEASSFAGTMKLGKLIAFYDCNKISIDGSTDLAFQEDVAKRYEAYGWQVLTGSMYDMPQIAELVDKAKKDERPSLIILKSVIGQGAPSVAGSAKAHGAPIGAEGVAEAKKNLGLNPEEQFYVAPEAYTYFEEKKALFADREKQWNATFEAWGKENPELKKEWDAYWSGEISSSVELPVYKAGDSLATRTASGAALLAFSKQNSFIVGGSADLQGPNATKLADTTDFSPTNKVGHYIRFGIREFAMGCIVNGIALHGGLKPFCATFMVFVDYMRPALRLAALMKLPVIYVLTHDSIFVGEDGPTHQPIETISALRAIPNVQVLRPGDAEETVRSWEIALKTKDHPVCLALTRQNVPVYAKEDPDWKNTMECGAYIVKRGSDAPDVTILATGSEVSMALAAAELVTTKTVRVVSVVDREQFYKQPDTLRETIMGKNNRVVVAEAGTRMGWESFVSSRNDLFCIDRFGESAPGGVVAKALGFTAEELATIISK